MFFHYLNEVAILILRQFLPQTSPQKNPRLRNLARLTSSPILEQLIPYHPRHQLEKHSIRPSISINPGRGGYSNSSNPCFLPLRRDGGITTLSASKAGVLKQCGRIYTHNVRTIWHCWPLELISLFLFLSSIQGMEFLFAEEDPNESDDESEKGGDGCLSKRVI